MPAQPQESSILSRVKNEWNSTSTLNKAGLGIAVLTGVASAATVAIGAALPVVGVVAVGGWAIASTAGVADFYVEKAKVAADNNLTPHNDRNVKTKEQKVAPYKANEIENSSKNQSNTKIVENIRDSTPHFNSDQQTPAVTPRVNTQQPKRAGLQLGK